MRVKKSNHITVVVCTLGYRNSLLAKKLTDLKSALDNLQISYEIYISHNFDKNQNEELIESQKLSGYDYIYHDIFYDTVEEHILNIFKYFHKRVDDGFIWPISDEDQFNLEDLNRFLRRIKNSRAEAVIANWRYESSAGLPAQQSAINYHSNAPSVKELILETGILHAPTKVGSWMIRSSTLKSERLKVWEDWLKISKIWTQAVFVYYLAELIGKNFIFVDETIFNSSPNPTDEDTSKSWREFFEKNNIIYQYPHTFGIVLVLDNLIQNEISSYEKISRMTISDSQRGSLPLVSDLEWRLMLQCRNAIYSSGQRMNIDEISQFCEIFKKWETSNKTIIAQLPTCLTNEKISYSKRFEALRIISDAFNQSQTDPFRSLLVYNNCSYKIYKLSTYYLTVPNFIEIAETLRLSHTESRCKFIHRNSAFEKARSQADQLPIDTRFWQPFALFHNPPLTKAPRFPVLLVVSINVTKFLGLENSKYAPRMKKLARKLGL